MIPWLLIASALAGDVRLLTYEDALAATEEHNPAIVKARIASDQANASVRTALGAFDPTISVTGGYNKSNVLRFQPPYPDPFNASFASWNVGTTVSGTAPTGTTLSVTGELQSSHNVIDGGASGSFTQDTFSPTFTFGLRQELLKGLILGYNLQNVRKSHQSADLAELQRQSARNEALAGAAKAYWGWVQASRLADLSHASVSVAEEALRVGRAKVEAGELAPVEATRLEAALVQARTTAIEADHTAAQARDTLLLAMGEAPGQELAPGSAVGDAPEYTLDVAKAVEVALQQSLTLAVARAQLDQARLAVRDAKQATLPTLTADVNGGVSGSNPNTWGEAFQTLGSFPTINATGTFSAPLGNRVATGQLQAATYGVATQEAVVAEAERQLTADVIQQVRVMEAARQKVTLADANVRLAEETLRAEEALQAVGRAIPKDVLESRDALDKARVEAVRARTDVRLAEVELLRLQGNVEPGA